ncbi:three-helix bundle dimerization domain-containing protein [Nocardia sp. NPDC057353]|uniref:three-helix bundle dimerization domain-containing protein n=1 Tax=Nocardia sp. NPDC057353 TaxID=3346104 RepID=UPI003645297A
MSEQEEAAQVEQVVVRLHRRYPLIPAADLELLVHTIHRRYAGCRVHDFVPLLVERTAREIAARLPVDVHPRTPELSPIVVIRG